MNKILSRTKVGDVVDRIVFGSTVRAGSVIETDEGFEAVLIVDGYSSFRSPGHTSEAAAIMAIRDLWNPEFPPFLMQEGWIIEDPEKLQTGAKVEAISPRGSGLTSYLITGETYAEVEDAIESELQTFHPSGYGTRFDEIELVDGVYRATGRRRNNWD